MRRLGMLLVAALALAGPWTSAVADVASDMIALRDALDARYAAGNTGECGGSGRGGQQIVGIRDELQVLIDGGTTPGGLRSILSRVAYCYPKEYKANTPNDISDLTDRLTPAVVPAMRTDLVQRLEFIDAQIALGKSCGHRGNADGAKHLTAMSKLGHSKLNASDAATTDAARYKILDAVMYSGKSLVWREEAFGDYPGYGWLPPSDGVISRMSARIAPVGPVVWGASDATSEGDAYGTMTASLSSGVLSMHVHYIPEDWIGDMGPAEPIIDIDFVVNGVTKEKKYPVSAFQSGTVTFSTYTGLDDGNGDPIFDLDVYDVQSGTFQVKEFCDDRISGVFTLRFKARTADRETGDDLIFTMNKGKFSVYTGN